MAEARARGRGLSWMLWWRIDPDELEKQSAEYQSLSFFKSARAGAALCLAISMAITGLFVAFKLAGFDASALIDVGLMAILAVFIALGQRWAMVGAMVLWTLEKILLMVGGIQGGAYGSPVLQIIWWCIYMHCFYFAFRVEQHRRRLMRSETISEAGQPS